MHILSASKPVQSVERIVIAVFPATRTANYTGFFTNLLKSGWAAFMLR
jgi:hypothetical protein